MDNQELFHNLVQLAAVDGKFTEEEIKFLVEKADQWGIPNDEFETALAGFEQGIELTMPAEKQDRIELLSHMIRLMAVDGELAETEKRLCAAASASMEISTKELADIIDSLLAE